MYRTFVVRVSGSALVLLLQALDQEGAVILHRTIRPHQLGQEHGAPAMLSA